MHALSRFSRRWGVGRIIATAILVFVAFLFLIPLLWMITSSLKPSYQILDVPPQFLPNPPRWSNYPEALSAIPFLTYLRNSLLLCAVTVCGAVLSSAIVAYGFARLQFKGKQPLFLLMIATMVLVTTAPVMRTTTPSTKAPPAMNDRRRASRRLAVPRSAETNLGSSATRARSICSSRRSSSSESGTTTSR